MDTTEFYQLVKHAFDTQDHLDAQLSENQFFLNELEKILLDRSIGEPLKMTRASILFEGYYQHLREEHAKLKQLLGIVRAKRWEKHFGAPTITFLLSYKHQIDLTKQLVDEGSSVSNQQPPWLVRKEKSFSVDFENNVLADPQSISRIKVPEHKEITGFFTKTHNPFGGFTTTPCDPISQQFIQHAALASKKGGKVLEVGAAFGAATLEAIAKGATVFCNDIDAANLAVVRTRFLESLENQSESITGDDVKRQL